MEAFKKESVAHGWPSFRPEETFHENVKILDNGEMVSTCGTHLGHNLPDDQGDRYCINLICVAGQPSSSATTVDAKVDETAWTEGDAAERNQSL